MVFGPLGFKIGTNRFDTCPDVVSKKVGSSERKISYGLIGIGRVYILGMG